MEKSYFELRVTVLHIVIFLLALILFGVFLFFMGYRAAGNRAKAVVSSGQKDVKESVLTDNREAVEEIAEREPVAQKPSAEVKKSAESIQQELAMHQIQEQKEAGPVKEEKAFPAKEHFTVQVGAFSDYQKARLVAEKYRQENYPVEIVAEIVRGRRLHLVRVGNFSTLREAEVERTKLEKREGQKFIVKKVQ